MMRLRCFCEDFMFRLSSKEWNSMSSQIVTTSFSKCPKLRMRNEQWCFVEHFQLSLQPSCRKSVVSLPHKLMTK